MTHRVAGGFRINGGCDCELSKWGFLAGSTQGVTFAFVDFFFQRWSYNRGPEASGSQKRLV